MTAVLPAPPVFGEAADESLVSLHFAAHLEKRAGFHGKPNAMVHEPCGFLRDTKRPVHFVAADPVLAVGNHPDRGKPLAEIDRAILEDRPDLGRELPLRMLFLAFPEPPCRDEADIGTTTGRAMHAIGPAQFDHRQERNVRIGEVPDGFDEGLWLREREWGVFHTDQYDRRRLLCQVY